MLGPTGAGRGTQAAALSTFWGLPHISTGDLFRTNIETNTSLGAHATAALHAGELVPDSVIQAMLAERLPQPDTRDGFVLDGFRAPPTSRLVGRDARRGTRHRRRHRSHRTG